jgi:hypothetical protein
LNTYSIGVCSEKVVAKKKVCFDFRVVKIAIVAGDALIAHISMDKSRVNGLMLIFPRNCYSPFPLLLALQLILY